MFELRNMSLKCWHVLEGDGELKLMKLRMVYFLKVLAIVLSDEKSRPAIPVTVIMLLYKTA